MILTEARNETIRYQLYARPSLTVSRHDYTFPLRRVLNWIDHFYLGNFNLTAACISDLCAY